MIDIDYFRDWFDDRLTITEGMVSHHGWRAEADAEIILCCAASAIAAKIWPGRYKDRKRFIQLLVKFAPNNRFVKDISTPLLVEHIAQEDPDLASNLIEELFDNPDEFDGLLNLPGRDLPVPILARIWTAPEVDQTEEVLETLLPEWSLGEIRHFSRATLIYSDLRSGLVHEYEISERLSAQGISARDDVPSYVNYLVAPDEVDALDAATRHDIPLAEARAMLTKQGHRLYIPYAYLKDLIVSTIRNAFAAAEDCESIRLSDPPAWWIDG